MYLYKISKIYEIFISTQILGNTRISIQPRCHHQCQTQTYYVYH